MVNITTSRISGLLTGFLYASKRQFQNFWKQHRISVLLKLIQNFWNKQSLHYFAFIASIIIFPEYVVDKSANDLIDSNRAVHKMKRIRHSMSNEVDYEAMK
jgi:hypothetical protein